jgi:hypothetical protein
MVLSVTPSRVTLDQTIADDYEWEYSGTDGIFTDRDNVYFVSLSPGGIVEKTFDITQAAQTASWPPLGLLVSGLAGAVLAVTILVLRLRRRAGS